MTITDLRKLNQVDISSAVADKSTAEALAASLQVGLQFTQTNFDLDEFAIEVGAFFVFLTLCMFSLLNEVNGDISQLKRYFLYRKLEIFPNATRNTNRVANMLFFSGIGTLIRKIIMLNYLELNFSFATLIAITQLKTTGTTSLKCKSQFYFS